MESLQSGKQHNPAETRKKENGQNRTVRECALALLEFRDRTERELRRKLKEREYSPEEIDETVLFLKEYRYLERKGVSREIIDLQLQEENVDEDSQIRKLLEKKGYEPGKRMEPAEYRRLMGVLGRRGFSGEAIRRVTESMREEYDSFL